MSIRYLSKLEYVLVTNSTFNYEDFLVIDEVLITTLLCSLTIFYSMACVCRKILAMCLICVQVTYALFLCSTLRIWLKCVRHGSYTDMTIKLEVVSVF